MTYFIERSEINQPYIGIIKWLLEKKANVNRVNELSKIPLVSAAEIGNKGIVIGLLECGAELNLVSPNGSYGRTALMSAIVNNHTKIAQFLLERGANVNLTNSSQETALGHACNNQNNILVRTIKAYKGLNIAEIDKFSVANDIVEFEIALMILNRETLKKQILDKEQQFRDEKPVEELKSLEEALHSLSSKIGQKKKSNEDSVLQPLIDDEENWIRDFKQALKLYIENDPTKDEPTMLAKLIFNSPQHLSQVSTFLRESFDCRPLLKDLAVTPEQKKTASEILKENDRSARYYTKRQLLVGQKFLRDNITEEEAEEFQKLLEQQAATLKP